MSAIIVSDDVVVGGIERLRTGQGGAGSIAVVIVRTWSRGFNLLRFTVRQ